MAKRTYAQVLREIDQVERGVRNGHIEKQQGDQLVASLRAEIKAMSDQLNLELVPPAAPGPAPGAPKAGKS